ncbi:hypothetical protein QN360_05530 [Glaciimonas sp. CA11.2]|uniref:hypothetical protein n=1 Tax=unclassified Glaciimonas TaxID=2644401 RepID=UPI002AB44B21|nr:MULTISPECIES: hypothetical protein [unclassified Glaciimonas]MDY7546355.1 hypothetical protein [Glaciimonas sp. CA11.2]MEB0010696.1 hypothetical protein [Glaciimonas sp. Cout2]MEB0082168.1 hypothetical protein [Glaciimonas sp. Gout2]MEB0162366.1 hypothetical protein [Glaciimonas sp. CA11.2]
MKHDNLIELEISALNAFAGPEVLLDTLHGAFNNLNQEAAAAVFDLKGTLMSAHELRARHRQQPRS